MKKATFKDVQTVNRARRERAARTHHPDLQATKEIEGFRVQPLLPLHCGLFGATCVEATFVIHDGKRCVEAMVKLGLLESPYTLVLSIEQALEADIIERVDTNDKGCRCEVCGGRNDDPAGIHGRRTYPVRRKDGRVLNVTIPQD